MIRRPPRSTRTDTLVPDTTSAVLTELRGAMTPMVNTPELRFHVDESRKFAIVDEVLARLAASGAKVDRTDGARVLTVRSTDRKSKRLNSSHKCANRMPYST